MSDSVPSITGHPELTPEKAKALQTIASAAGGRAEETTAGDVAANIQRIKQGRAGMPGAAQTMKGHNLISSDIVSDLDKIAFQNNDRIPDNVKGAVATLVQGSGMSADRAKELVTNMESGEKEIVSATPLFGHDDKALLAKGTKRFNDAASDLGNAMQVSFDSDVKKNLDIQDAKAGHTVTPLASGAKPVLNAGTPHK